MTSFGESDQIAAAIKAGALGYVLKDIFPDDLAEALRDTYKGKSKLHPDIAQKLIAHVQQDQLENNPVQDQLKELTDREIEVLTLIARGMSNREIAAALSISPMTVKTHVSNLLGKLQLSDRTQAAILAIRLGLAPNE